MKKGFFEKEREIIPRTLAPFLSTLQESELLNKKLSKIFPGIAVLFIGLLLIADKPLGIVVGISTASGFMSQTGGNTTTSSASCCGGCCSSCGKECGGCCTGCCQGLCKGCGVEGCNPSQCTPPS